MKEDFKAAWHPSTNLGQSFADFVFICHKSWLWKFRIYTLEYNLEHQQYFIVINGRHKEHFSVELLHMISQNESDFFKTRHLVDDPAIKKKFVVAATFSTYEYNQKIRVPNKNSIILVYLANGYITRHTNSILQLWTRFFWQVRRTCLENEVMYRPHYPFLPRQFFTYSRLCNRFQFFFTSTSILAFYTHQICIPFTHWQ